MNLLYLTEDYLHSKVHNNLIIHMLEQDGELRVFVFVPTRQRAGENLTSSFRHHERLFVIAAPIDLPTSLYRLDFWAKIRCKVRLIEKYIPIKEIDAIHAATLFIEGCTARALNKKYGIPYFVSMRGSDSDFYAKKMIHLWHMSYGAIKHASELNFVSPSIKAKIIAKKQYKKLQCKLINGKIINNGIDEIWLESLNPEQKHISSPIRVLYIGRFDSNKNVMRLIESIKKLRQDKDIRLTFVGGDGEQQALIEEEISQHPDYLEYLGKIYDKQQLKNIVRQHDIFVMISHSETFGLVYAECLTQGLPIIYTRGTGFDDMYPQGEVGYGVNSFSMESIKEGLLNVISNYDHIRENISRLNFDRYSWDGIAKQYIEIYKLISHVN